MENEKYYRSDLLKIAYEAAGNTSRGFQSKTGIAAKTQRQALNGESMQLNKLREFAGAVGVCWSSLFDFDSTLEKLKEINNL